VKFSDHLPDAFDDDTPDQDEEAELDREFPLGDGTADTDALVTCPYCGESVEITLDPGSGAVQEYVEDCEVCCQPWRVSVTYGEGGAANVSITALDQ
jgi:hypothetical protein